MCPVCRLFEKRKRLFIPFGIPKGRPRFGGSSSSGGGGGSSACWAAVRMASLHDKTGKVLFHLGGSPLGTIYVLLLPHLILCGFRETTLYNDESVHFLSVGLYYLRYRCLGVVSLPEK